tara:strand:+ start:9284 stop:9901 length:618 start_codon:yes stop_codon:yes gene_type:complete
MSDKSKVPPIIIQHPEDGTFRIGRERDEESVEPTVRKADVSLQAGSAEAGGPAASLRLFHDGGFELRSTPDPSGIQGSQILQLVEDAPLIIHSKGGIIFDCEGTFAVTANDIQMRAKNRAGLEKPWNQSGNINLKASKNIKIDADKAVTVTSENVTLDAKKQIISHSEGWNIICGRIVRIHEPRSQLIPSSLQTILDTYIAPLKG